MDLTDDYSIPAPREAVWTALNDPEVLKACIPNCEELTKNSDTEFVAKVVVKIGPVKASFGGRVTLSDIDAPKGYTITGEGQGGAAGFAKVRLEPVDGGAATILHYTADAQIGGKLAQIGSRLVEGSARKLADEFFADFAAQATAKAATLPSAAPAIVLSPEAVPVAAAHEPAGATALGPELSKRGLSPWVWVVGLTAVGAILAAVIAAR